MTQIWTGVKRLRNHARHKAVRDANRARDSGDPARAATLYQAVLDRWGPHFGILVQLGNMLKDSSQFERAEQVYHAALRLHPLDADCHLQLGHLLKVSGHANRAAMYYREANRLSPTLEGALIELRTMEDEEAAARARTAQDAVPEAGNGHPTPIDDLPKEPAAPPDRHSRAVVVHQRLLTGLKRRRN